jgi:hypothetical protein
MIQESIINLYMAMTVQYLVQLKLYFEVSTILTFIYTEIYLAYFFIYSSQ